ncbi:hypothetical protein C8R43DRAFT_952242 [Mycena crocata]|nr:hypothetical protein C8R43DRAFT_952242 [Mycena crocata]
MLNRGLREDRHPSHAAESDRTSTSAATAGLSDVLAQALEYELELAALGQTNAKRPDPGRPPYSYPLYFLNKLSQQACEGSTKGIVRMHTTSSESACEYHCPVQCPGINIAGVYNCKPFPVIETLLSLPFALLHQVPRLSAIVPLSRYQSQVLELGLAIMKLWAFDPVGDTDPAPQRVLTRQRHSPQFYPASASLADNAWLNNLWEREESDVKANSHLDDITNIGGRGGPRGGGIASEHTQLLPGPGVSKRERPCN